MKRKILSLVLGILMVCQLIFSCGVVFATDAPTVLQVTPNGENVTKATVASVEFSEKMDRTTLNSANIVVTDVTDGDAVVTQTKASAYDTSYVFMCDFAANKTYKVTVSTNVKSASGVPLAASYSHTFTTGSILYGTENVTPTSDAGISSNFKYNGEYDGSTKNYSDLYDGNISSYWYTFGVVSPKWVQLDLGKAVDIAYVSYVNKSPFAGADYIKDIQIQVAKDEGFTNPVTLSIAPEYTEYVGGTTLEWIVASASTEKYQYVRIFKAGIDMGISEIDVFAYEAATEVISVSPAGDNVTKASIANVTFGGKMDKSTLNSANIVVTDVTNGDVVVAQTKSFVYDNEYTFMCDFKPATEYKITVSTNVKSAAGLPLGEAYVHTFTTGNALYATEDVTPTEASGYTYKFGSWDATRKNIDVVYDADTTSYLYTYGSGPNWVKVDLGKPIDLAYITYFAKGPDTGDYQGNVKIEVANDIDFTNPVTLSTVPAGIPYTAKSVVEWNAAPHTADKYQYVRIYQPGVYFGLSEIKVFSYESDPAVKKITPSGSGVLKASVCNVTFDREMDKATLNAENIVVTDVTNSRTVAQKKASVYDSEYAFICDFKPNTEYKITVSTNVKAKNGLPFAANYEHSFTTGDYIYYPVDITPNAEGAYSWKAENTSGGINVVYNGLTNGVWNTYGYIKPVYLQADLGKEQDIAYISFHGKREQDSDTFVSDVKIQVSKTAEFNEGDYVELNCTPTMADKNSGLIEWIAVNDTDEQYRYVRITKNDTVMYVSELTVYAYLPVIEAKKSTDIIQSGALDKYKLEGYQIYGSAARGEKIAFVTDVAKLNDEVPNANVYAALYNTTSGNRIVKVVKAVADGEKYVVSSEIPTNETVNKIKFFVWSDGLSPLMSNVLKAIN